MTRASRLEVTLVFNGFGKHMEEGKRYREILEKLFKDTRNRVRLIVESREISDGIIALRKEPTPCKVEYAYLLPDRSSMILFKRGAAVRGCYFNHESQPGAYSRKDAARMWEVIKNNIKKPSRQAA